MEHSMSCAAQSRGQTTPSPRARPKALFEALAYSLSGWRHVPGGLRVELHDDGYTALMPGRDLSLLARPASINGSRIAEKKDRCLGPRSAEIVRAGFSREACSFIMVAGSPVGDTLAGLRQWRQRYDNRLWRIRQIASHDLAIAAQVMHRIGGPAGLAAHLLQTVAPTPEIREFWANVDAQWGDLWLDILQLEGEERAHYRQRVTSRATVVQGGFGGRLAADHAEMRYAESLSRTIPTLEKILN